MPYIKQETRDDVDPFLAPLLEVVPNLEAGTLNYVITRILLETAPGSYEGFNRLLGVLEAIKLEFYLRMIAPYEAKKCKENGDVYS